MSCEKLLNLTLTREQKESLSLKRAGKSSNREQNKVSKNMEIVRSELEFASATTEN